jgi:hypothetical protein
MSLFGRRGNLEDFIPHAGDPAYVAKITSKAQRWGSRYLLSTDPALLNLQSGIARNKATAIDTGTLPRTCQIHTQMRFALNGPNNGPILPFTPFCPLLTGIFASLQVNVRRGADEQAPSTADVFGVDQAVGVLPFDILPARSLGIDLTLVSPGGFSTVWVETISTIVNEPATRDKIIGWPRLSAATAPQALVAAVASPASVQFFRDRADRVQFIIVNTSTNANLILSFGTADATWVGPVGAIVLPMNGFFSYESPVGGWRGRVTGSWNHAAPNGGALVTEGVYYSGV